MASGCNDLIYPLALQDSRLFTWPLDFDAHELAIDHGHDIRVPGLVAHNRAHAIGFWDPLQIAEDIGLDG